LFEQLKPRVFVDPMVGRGTSVQVAKEMNIEAYGLDLHQGFNAISDSIIERVGKPADLIVSHPPYGSMIRYSGPGGMWGDTPHPHDLSHCVDDDDFNDKMQQVMLNQRRATTDGGVYGTLIGDWRRQGSYSCYMADIVARLPRDELAAVIIKGQFNCMSDRKSYGRMTLPPIMHEYLVLFRKKARPVLVLMSDMINEQARRTSTTWKNLVKTVMLSLGGRADLQTLYTAIAQSAPERLANNEHWRAKVRQTLNTHKQMFAPLERGVWAVA
jgi:hypothetical protein